MDLISPLTPTQASLQRFLAFVRGPWSIEHSSHSVRDVTCGDDRSRVRTGDASRMLAALRHVALTFMHRSGFSPIAASRRPVASHPQNVCALLIPKQDPPQSSTSPDSFPQGIPMRGNGTPARKHQSESLLKMSVKETHLSGHMANAHLIHQTHDCAMKLSKKAGNRPGTGMTGILSSAAVTAKVETTFDGPMLSEKFQHTCGWSFVPRETADPRDHFLAKFPRFEQACRAFKPKNLSNAFPWFAQPVVEVRATDQLAMFEPPMPFVPGLCLLPSSLIRVTTLLEIGMSFPQRGLVVFGYQKVCSFHRCTRA